MNEGRDECGAVVRYGLKSVYALARSCGAVSKTARDLYAAILRVADNAFILHEISLSVS